MVNRHSTQSDDPASSAVKDATGSVPSRGTVIGSGHRVVLVTLMVKLSEAVGGHHHACHLQCIDMLAFHQGVDQLVDRPWRTSVPGVLRHPPADVAATA